MYDDNGSVDLDIICLNENGLVKFLEVDTSAVRWGPVVVLEDSDAVNMPATCFRSPETNGGPLKFHSASSVGHSIF